MFKIYKEQVERVQRCNSCFLSVEQLFIITYLTEVRLKFYKLRREMRLLRPLLFFFLAVISGSFEVQQVSPQYSACGYSGLTKHTLEGVFERLKELNQLEIVTSLECSFFDTLPFPLPSTYPEMPALTNL